MGKAFVIGVAGGSASGKSTFSKMLKEKLENRNVLILSMDSYFLPEDKRAIVQAPYVNKTYRDDNHPTSFDLKQLKSDLSKAIDEGNFDVIILEGLLVLWDSEIYEQLDLRIFIECSSDERIVRRLNRNMKWGLTFDQIADVYLDLVRYRYDEYVAPTKWRSDFIINGSGSFDKILDILVKYIACILAQ